MLKRILYTLIGMLIAVSGLNAAEKSFYYEQYKGPNWKEKSYGLQLRKSGVITKYEGRYENFCIWKGRQRIACLDEKNLIGKVLEPGYYTAVCNIPKWERRCYVRVYVKPLKRKVKISNPLKGAKTIYYEQWEGPNWREKSYGVKLKKSAIITAVQGDYKNFCIKNTTI